MSCVLLRYVDFRNLPIRRGEGGGAGESSNTQLAADEHSGNMARVESKIVRARSPVWKGRRRSYRLPESARPSSVARMSSSPSTSSAKIDGGL